MLGKVKDSAVRTLESAGYAVSTSKVYTSSKASGIVVGQTPAGGAPLESGGTVAIVLSANTSASGNVKTPSVVGLSQASAESKVKAAGLVPYITYGRTGSTDGHVISQWPLGGESVPAGSEVLVQVQLNP